MMMMMMNIYIYIYIYRKLRCTSPLLKPEKISPELEQLIKQDVNPHVVDRCYNTLKNRYTPFTIISMENHRYFYLKLIFGDHIKQINSEINIR